MSDGMRYTNEERYGGESADARGREDCRLKGTRMMRGREKREKGRESLVETEPGIQ